MNAFKKLISISILAVIMVATLSLQVEAKKFDRSYLGLGKSARARHSSSFLGGDPDRPVIAGPKTLRKSSSAHVAAGNANGDDRARKQASRNSSILPYLEQDNIYK